MEMEIDPDHRNFQRILSAKQQITQSIFTATVRVDAAGMRKQTNDRLGEILALVKAERAAPKALDKAPLPPSDDEPDH